MQHGAYRMNKRANVMDLVLQPLFVTIVALGIVLLILLSSINDIKSSTTYEKKFYSADMALLIESMFALPKDINAEMKYSFPAEFGMTVENNAVKILPEEAKLFYFTEDPLYRLQTISLQPSKIATTLLFYKAGNNVGIDNRASFSPNPNSQYCEYPAPSLKLTVDYRATISDKPTLIVTGDALLSARLNTSGEAIAKIYISPVKGSEQIACIISQEIINNIGINTAIIPVNTQLLSADDARIMLQGAAPALYIDIHGIPEDASSKSKILQAVRKGVGQYGVV